MTRHDTRRHDLQYDTRRGEARGCRQHLLGGEEVGTALLRVREDARLGPKERRVAVALVHVQVHDQHPRQPGVLAPADADYPMVQCILCQHLV